MIKTKNGFTIIEVSLVLVIGGLIFMMVFFALPAMRRQQRDTERKDDVMMLVEAIKKYQTNNRGALPDGFSGTGSWPSFMQMYVDEKYGTTDAGRKTFVDPNGDPYYVTASRCGNSGSTCANYSGINFDYVMHVYTQATCDDIDQRVKAINNPRDFVVVYRTESAGVYCQSS